MTKEIKTFFEKRAYQVREVATTEGLADQLTKYTWVCCAGFRLGGLLFLNDSTSANGAQEYAVLMETEPGQFYQVESITLGWCNRQQAIQCIKRCQEFEKGTAEPPMRVAKPINLNHGGRCPLCA